MKWVLIAELPVHFQVTDCDFSEVIYFLTSISTAAGHALLKNNNLHVHMVFTTEHVGDWMFRGTLEWLGVCRWTTRNLQRKPFNGIRIPWIYHADVEDMFVHMEWEQKVSRWPKRFEEWDTELQIIKECFQEAPLL